MATVRRTPTRWSVIQRFEPLHTVADALIAHLVDEYDVVVAKEPDPARPDVGRMDGFDRCVRLTPSDPHAVSLTFLFYPFPSITIKAGLVHWEPFPDCGCDHCDETALSAADDLEKLVLLVAEGGSGEHTKLDGVDGRWRAWPRRSRESS